MSAPNTSKQSRAKKAAAKQRPSPRLADALAEAGWAEADHALAEAIRESGELEQALTRLKGSKAAKAHAADALALVSQALARAARRRGLARFGVLGEVVAFAPDRHEFARTPPRPPARVRIVAEGVMRGSDVLIPALVKSARAATKKTRR